MSFELTIITPEGKEDKQAVDRLSLPTEDGIRTVLANHMEMVIPVAIGQIKLINPSSVTEYAVSEGLFHFKDNQAKLLVRTFESPKEIDQKRAQEAYERAKDRIEKKKQSKAEEIDFKRAEMALKRAIARLNVKG